MERTLERVTMLRIVSKLRWARLLAALAAGMSFAMLDCHTAAGQNSHAGQVTGVIDGVAFEGDQYYVHGWACQQGNRGSIGINIYANHPAGGKPPGTYVMAGTADLNNEPAVDPSSWRGWDGKSFSVTFVDPYKGPVPDPKAHVCAPVPYVDYSTGINYHPASHLFVATLWNQGSAS